MAEFAITKLDAAHSQVFAAIHMYFSGGDPAPVHTLACAAREIYEKHCEAAGIGRNFSHKRQVNFQAVNRKTLQIAHVREAGAKIIDRQRNARFF